MGSETKAREKMIADLLVTCRHLVKAGVRAEGVGLLSERGLAWTGISPLHRTVVWASVFSSIKWGKGLVYFPRLLINVFRFLFFFFFE